MLKKIIVGLLLTSSLFAETELWKFFKYSTAYASFSLNAPRHQDDRFAIVGGLSTGQLEFKREKRELEPDFQKSLGIRKIGRFKYEPKRGVKNAGNGGTWYDGSEQSANENATFGPVKGWEFLLKWSEGRQWGDDYLNQEYWLRYVGEWFMIKGGYTELGLEDVQYVHGDFRIKKSIGGLNISAGVKHRQHPVYGFDAAILDTTWYKGQWWDFAERAFGVDDNQWTDNAHVDENGDWIKNELIEYRNGEWVTIEGDGPFWHGEGEAWGYDWLWRGEDGSIFAYTDREFFLYHFPEMLEEYISEVKTNLGYQRETSLVLGGDFYHYAENWWLHAWGNLLPYHYGHDTYSYHNAHSYKQHKDDKKPPHLFQFGEAGWKAWNDYDFGAIFGVKIKDNLGVFAEGRYLYYWDKPAYDLKFGMNYQFVGW